MKTTIHKIFINYENEEKWINQMSQKGYHFVHYSFMTYRFEQGEPGAYVYKIELLENTHNHPDSRAYLQFLEEAGIECSGSWFRWVYLRKKADGKPFDLYTDLASKIKHFKSILTLFSTVLLINLSMALLNFFIGLGTGSHINLSIPLLNCLVVILLTYPTLQTYRHIKALEKEQQIRE